MIIVKPGSIENNYQANNKYGIRTKVLWTKTMPDKKVTELSGSQFDKAGGIAGRFGVQAIPTLLLFKDGNEVRRFVGVQPRETLIDAISAAV